MESSIYHFVKYVCEEMFIMFSVFIFISVLKSSCDCKLSVTQFSQSLNTLQIKSIADQVIQLQNSE